MSVIVRHLLPGIVLVGLGAGLGLSAIRCGPATNRFDGAIGLTVSLLLALRVAVFVLGA